MKLVRSSILAVVAAVAVSNVAFAKEHHVGMDKMKFVPANLTVAVGDTVVWVNNDSQKQPHNVTSKEAKLFTSKPVMMVGEKFTWKATKKGAHKYTCTIHPGMDGTLTVK